MCVYALERYKMHTFMYIYPMARLSLLIVFFDGNSLSFGDKLYILF